MFLVDASHLEDGDSTAVTGEQSNAEGTSSAAEDTPVSKRTPVKRGAKASCVSNLSWYSEM